MGGMDVAPPSPIRSLVFPAIAFVSAGALIVALIAQYGFELEPCELCVYQRLPYVAALIIGVVGAAVDPMGHRTAAYLVGWVFLLGVAIAFYHVGVEQHWWQAATACGAGNAELPQSFSDFRQGLGNLGPVKACDEVDWTLFGVSMASYNAAVSLVLALASFWAAGLWRKDVHA